MGGESFGWNLKGLRHLHPACRVEMEALDDPTMLQDVNLSLGTKEIDCFLPHRSHETSHLLMELLFTSWAVSFKKC